MRRMHAFGDMPQVLQDFFQRFALRQLQPHAPVARKVAGRRENQVAGTGQAEDGLGGSAHRHAEAGDLGQAAGDERGARVVTEAEAVADAGGDRHHILHRAADLDADEVGAVVHAHAPAVQQCRRLARESGIAGGERQRAGQAARHLFGKRRAGQGAATCAGSQRLLDDLVRKQSGVLGSKPLHSQTSGARLSLSQYVSSSPRPESRPRKRSALAGKSALTFTWGGISTFGR